MKAHITSSGRLAMLGIALLCWCVPAKAEPGVAFLVLPEFANVLTNAPAANPIDHNSLALFSGSLGGYLPPGSTGVPVIPTNNVGVQLARCGFGQMLARSVPFQDFEFETIRLAQAKLYPPLDANTRELVAGSGAAFRYRDLLYERTNTNVRAQFESIATYFGDTERDLAQQGIDILRNALKYSPLNRQLRNALLDAYYDWIIAEAQYVKNELAEVAKYRLGLVTIPPGDFIIDHEIAGYTNILQKYERILDAYGQLFSERSGVDVSQFDPSAPAGMLLGQWIFQKEQPQRNQMAAQFWDTNGVLTSVPLAGSTNSMLFAGYKDYVALLGVLRDYSQSAAELAKFYGMRGRAAVLPGQKDDKTLGFELIDRVNHEILLNTSLLQNLLPNAVPPESELDASGVRAALAGVLTGSAELTKVGLFLSSQVNMLGFDPDFLALISTFVDVGSQQRWDSYDALRGWLDFPNQSSSILGRARNSYATAKASYDTYRGYADQVATQLSANEDSYSQRYREISGYAPGEPADPYPYPVPKGRYPPVDTNRPPTHINNPRGGSELRQVHQSIEQSDAKAASLEASALVLSNQIQTARARLQSSSNRIDSIDAAILNYTNVIVSERDNITKWSVTQAASQAAYDAIADCAAITGGASIDTPCAGAALAVTAIAGAANIIVQSNGEQQKGDSQKALDLAAANFDKDLAMADAEQNIYQAGEEQRNIDREFQAQVLTAQDNAFVRNQDMERMDGLLREMQQVQTLRDQNNAGLAGRYYADPIHYLRAQNDMLHADFTFRSAQRWVFLALRALEYKYNQPFVYSEGTPGSPRWELASLFKLRNANELDDLLSAMDQFNLGNLGKLNGRSTVTERISLKNDVWGRTYTNEVDRVAKFRKGIADSYDPQRGVYVVKLDTLRLSKELENGSFFIGAEYGLNGSVITPGYYLDKIEWLKVKFVDPGAPSPVTKTGDLSYGGTCFVRPPCAAAFGGGLESANELRHYPFRYYSMGTDPDTGVLEADSSADQRATVNFAFWNQPDKSIEPGSDYAETFWKERSVAITDLNLTIAAGKVNTNTLQDVHIYIRHLYALRTVCP